MTIRPVLRHHRRDLLEIMALRATETQHPQSLTTLDAYLAHDVYTPGTHIWAHYQANGAVLGFIKLRRQAATWRVKSLFVAPHVRQQGIARQLVHAAANAVCQRGGDTVEWCPPTTPMPEGFISAWPHPHCGADGMCRYDRSQLDALAFLP